MSSNLLSVIELHKNIWVVILLILQTGALPAATFISGKLLATLADDELFNQYLVYTAVAMAGGTLLIGLISFIVLYGGSVLIARFRIKALAELFMKEPAYFEKTNSGVISSILVSEVNSLQTACSLILPEIVRNILAICWTLVLVAIVKWYFFLVLVGQAMVIGLLSIPINKKLANIQQRKIQADRAFAVNQIEMVNNWRIIRVFAAEGHFTSKIRNTIRQRVYFEKLIAAVGGFSSAALGIISALVAILLTYWGKILWSINEISIGDIYIVWQSTVSIQTSVRLLVGKIAELVAISVSVDNIFNSIQFGKHILPNAQGVDVPESNWEVTLQNVSYKHLSSREYTLKEINITIKPNCLTAIVGVSGAGKSTIATLILQLGGEYQGDIAINGINMKLLDKTQYYNSVGYVAQDMSIFDGSIEENIRLGNSSCSFEDVEIAAKKAMIHDYILSLPEGFKSQVGERGLKLSGGQKQRIAIARALVRKPRLLILDEATSALDSQSENYIKDSLDQIASSVTTLVIAHRLSTIKDAALIYVLHSGAVVESGTYQELCNAKGFFHLMVANQIMESRNVESVRDRSKTR